MRRPVNRLPGDAVVEGMESTRRPVSLGHVLLPLRGFLAFTFLYAGLQKLANPQFLDWQSSTSLHAQLLSQAVRTSPIYFGLSHLVDHATLLGIGIATAEIAVGIGMALGLFTRVAALGGMVLALSLFLAISFHTSPWYTGADIVYLFAFTPLVLAGAGGVLSLDGYLATHPVRLRRGEVDRRMVLLGGLAAAFGVVLAGADAAFGRLIGGAKVGKAPVTLGSTGSTGPTGPTGSTGGGHHGTLLGKASALPVGQAGTFTVPSSGDPGLVVHTTAGAFVAYDAVCPHAGCTVGYYAQQDLIACPCHGSIFNTATGAVESGPAPRGLTPLTVVDEGGDLYLT